MPRQVELLDHIHNAPKYYSGYYIRTLVCNLKVKGSAPAEQNHSSTVSNLGKGSMWSISEQLTRLTERQQHHHIRNMRMENNWWFSAFKTKPRLEGNVGLQEQKAKQSLAQWPFIKIWQQNSNAAKYYDHKESDDKSSYVVWPLKEGCNENNVIVIEKGTRCQCQYRLDYDGQCSHELCIDHTFRIDHVNPRWYTRSLFNNVYPQYACIVEENNTVNQSTNSLRTEVQLDVV